MSTPARFWAVGDYDRVAMLIAEMGRAVVAAAVRPGARVLDDAAVAALERLKKAADKLQMLVKALTRTSAFATRD